MNKIQEEHWEEIPMSYNMDEKLNNHFDITIKYMKGFGSYLMEYYWKTKGGLYAKIGDEYTDSILNTPMYTENQVIEEYIKQL